jgi:hypothetical protein
MITATAYFFTLHEAEEAVTELPLQWTRIEREIKKLAMLDLGTQFNYEHFKL